MVKEGKKFDQDKPDITLVPSEFIEGVAKVFGFGMKKYGRNNFKAGMDHSRVISAAFRHLLAINRGEDLDPESGAPHWAHAACCLAMYAFYVTHGVGTDDRYKEDSNQPA